MATIASYFEKFKQLKIMVIGDAMIDAYSFGRVSRISPEAPVPIIEVSKKHARLGGAANVLLNLKSLGAEAILFSVIGNDKNGNQLKKLLHDAALSDEGLQHSSTRPTTTKLRIIAQGQQMLRIDEENDSLLSSEEEINFLLKVKHFINENKPNVIIFEDYDKGVITQKLIDEVVATAKNLNILTTADPKKRNFLSYKGVDLFKPNLKELEEGLNSQLKTIDKPSLDHANEKLSKILGHKNSLITLGAQGVYFNHSFNQSGIISAHYRKITDVSGAGDTVISVVSCCLAVGMPFVNAAKLANLSGGLVCEETGVVPIDRNRLLQEAEMLDLF